MIAFTLCSNNYLAYASVLCASLKANHPDYIFVLGLVDEINPEVNYAERGFDFVLPVAEINIPDFEQMCARYNIIELNTAVKPFYCAYLLNHYPTQNLFYFDPDIRIYASLESLSEHFVDYSILLIPHYSTPQVDQLEIITPEIRILQRGLYNLGFLGLRNDAASRALLTWWQERLQTQGFLQPEKGLFVDQKWMDLAPLYFDNVAVLKKSGCDVAYWNLYEYNLSMIGGQVYAEGEPLRFYHFSAFKLEQPDFLEKFLQHFSPQKKQILYDLYSAYRDELFAQGHESFRQLSCVFFRESHLSSLTSRVKKNIKSKLLSLGKR